MLTETTTYLVYGVLSPACSRREKKERLTTVDAKSPPMALVIGTIERMGGPTKRTILKAGRLQTAVWPYLT